MTGLVCGRESSALRLMERALRDGDPLAEEYPLVFREGFPGRIVALGEGDEVRSACATLVRELVLPDGNVRGGLIGSVSTDPDWQGQGLGTRLLIEAEAALQSRNCVFAMLWGEDPHFYLSRGYCPMGAEEDFAIPRTLSASLPSSNSVRASTEDDAAGVHALYERHPERMMRTAEETAALLRCPGMTTLVLECDGELAGYACRGRGHDLPDAIHEWGGEIEDVLSLVRGHLEDRFPDDEEGDLFLMAPVTAVDLRSRLESLGVESHRGFLGLGKILDRNAAMHALRSRIEPAGQVNLVETTQGPMFHLTGPEKEGYLDDDGLLALLFAATDVRDDVANLLRSFGLTDTGLPLEPFIWGLDSI